LEIGLRGKRLFKIWLFEGRSDGGGFEKNGKLTKSKRQIAKWAIRSAKTEGQDLRV